MTHQQQAGTAFYVRDGLGRVRGPYTQAFVLRLATSSEAAAFEVSRDGVKFARLVDEPSIQAALGPRSQENTPPVGVAPVAAPSRRDELRRLLERWKQLTPDQLLMLEEDNTCDPSAFYSTFALTPVPLAAGLRAMFA